MTKQEKIKQLIEMQKKFIEKEQNTGVSMQEYFSPDEQSELHGYSENYMKIAMEIVADAHQEVGSKP